jgi:class 3 adenylate cyclase
MSTYDRMAMRAMRLHLRVYLIFMLFFIGIWAATGAGYFWPIWPMLGWGLGLALHMSAAVPGQRHKEQKQAARDERKQVRHADRAERRERPERPARPTKQVKTRPSQPPALPSADLSDILPPPMPAQPAMAPARSPDVDAVTTPASGIPRALPVTVMFTDVVGSTQLNEDMGDDAWADMLVAHRRAVRNAVGDSKGREVGTQGDGFLVQFDSPADAVTAACRIQADLAHCRETGTFQPEIRIGIHAGEAIDTGDDLLGRVVNVASRVCEVAGAGEILVTEPVAERLTGRVPVVSRGLVTLKGVGTPRHAFAVDWDDRLTPH